MADARSLRHGAPAMGAGGRLGAVVLLFSLALPLSAAERGSAPRTDDLSLQTAYADAVRARILEHWLRPASVLPGQRCSTHIVQFPTGHVIAVETEPDCQFDAEGRTSLRNAVLHAQPLPIVGFESVYLRNLYVTFVAE